jgi:hypothetical protein
MTLSCRDLRRRIVNMEFIEKAVRLYSFVMTVGLVVAVALLIRQRR